MPSDPVLWRNYRFADQKEIRLERDHLCVRLLQRGNDLLLVEKRGENLGQVQLGADPEADFRRYAFQRPIKEVRVLPRTLNRPLVVQPIHPLRLAPNAKVDFYVSSPVDIQLSVPADPEDEPIETIRSEILSDTWFGDQLAGTFCYALKSRARRDWQSIDLSKSVRAICKVTINNESAEQLHCKKFCLRLDHCHLWLSENRLWTSPITIRYHGGDQLSAIDYSEKAPKEAVGAEQIADANEDPEQGLIRRTFTQFTEEFS
ncbi:MAG: DUF432 domain-containing protein [Opitutaceae bacterium]